MRKEIGPLMMTDLPVMESDKMDDAVDAQATLGLAALKRLEILIDGRRGTVSMRDPRD